MVATTKLFRDRTFRSEDRYRVREAGEGERLPLLSLSVSLLPFAI